MKLSQSDILNLVFVLLGKILITTGGIQATWFYLAMLIIFLRWKTTFAFFPHCHFSSNYRLRFWPPNLTSTMETLCNILKRVVNLEYSNFVNFSLPSGNKLVLRVVLHDDRRNSQEYFVCIYFCRNNRISLIPF